MNCKKVFDKLVEGTKDYVVSNKLKAMILGISGGIDSTIVAVICNEVSKQTGIPLIGRSLPIKNKEDEFDVSKLVGKAFCDDFKVIPIEKVYNSVKDAFSEEEQTPIVNGNIQARLRMIYLYNLASIHKGIVLSTDNQTEYQLGFWTIHGDVGDFDPIQDLWKTEVYELAEWLLKDYNYNIDILCTDDLDATEYFDKRDALAESIKLIPTDGLGISNSDLDQIGADSYEVVDKILKAYTWASKESKKWVLNTLIDYYPQEIINNIISRHNASAFKREKSPIKINLTFNEKMGFE